MGWKQGKGLQLFLAAIIVLIGFVRLSYTLFEIREDLQDLPKTSASSKNIDKKPESQQHAPSLFLPTPPRSFFMLITKGNVITGKRTPQMAIESACYHHPNARIYLYIMSKKGSINMGGVKAPEAPWVNPNFVDMLREVACHIEVRDFDPATFFHGTPLEEWIASKLNYLQAGPHWYSHVTDLFRLAVLYRYGGWYLDSDVIVIRPLDGLSNCLGAQSKDYYNNAISHFDARHEVLHATMVYIQQNYRRSMWSTAGPHAITRSLERWPHKNCKNHGSMQQCVQTLDETAFFPVHWQLAQTLVASLLEVPDELLNQYNGDWVPNTTFAFHYWNRGSAGMPLYESSIVYQLYRMSCVLCNVDVVHEAVV